ncbi:LysR family transcriptional regulator [Cytobacillus depressus]|nr:LysR family transcriptional regulator [Cytobacillus depressus]
MYVVEIARTGSISAAAERLHVSQPSISQGISSLEVELGIKLFIRSKVGALPTESGKSVIFKAQEILNKVEELQEIANTEYSLLKGRLSIAAIAGISTSILPKTLVSFKKKYPGIELEIIEEDSHIIRQLVNDGKTDIGLIGGEYNDSNLVCGKLFRTVAIACVGKHSIFAKREAISIKEVINHPVICSSEALKNILNKHGNPNYLIKSKNLEAAKHIIAQGIAIGFYTEMSLKVDPYVQTGDIIPLEISDETIAVDYSFIQLKTHRSTASQEFLKELKEQIILFQMI